MVAYLIRRFAPIEMRCFQTSYYGAVVGFLLPAILLSLRMWPVAAAPGWVYLLLATAPLVSGVLIEVLSRRIAPRLAINGIMMGMLACASGVPFSIGISYSVGAWPAALGIAGLITSQLVFIHWAYRREASISRELGTPQGPSGTLDDATGWIDPSVTSNRAIRAIQPQKTAMRWVWAFSPLFAGISVALARATSFQTDQLLITICMGGVAVAMSGAVGAFICRFRTTRAWERAHGIPVQLKRRRDWQRAIR